MLYHFEDEGRFYFQYCYYNLEFVDLREDFRVYTDEVNKFKISIPQGEFLFQITRVNFVFDWTSPFGRIRLKNDF